VQTALVGKADAAATVVLSGDQTVAGTKTSSALPVLAIPASIASN
jgi:hypothetical protein